MQSCSLCSIEYHTSPDFHDSSPLLLFSLVVTLLFCLLYSPCVCLSVCVCVCCLLSLSSLSSSSLSQNQQRASHPNTTKHKMAETTKNVQENNQQKKDKNEKIDKVAVENDLTNDTITEKYKEAAKVANSNKTQTHNTRHNKH